MKIKWYIPLMLMCICIFAFTSCSKSSDEEDLTSEETQDFSFTQAIVVNNETEEFSESVVLKATDYNKAFDEFDGKIKSIEVKQIKYIITNFNGPENQELITASLSVADGSGNGAEILATATNMILADIQNQEQTIDPETAGLNKLQLMMKNSPHTATMTLSGTANSTPITLTLTYTIKGSITVYID
ncbi:hypothetical protein PbJCM13498_16820 [Prolixibacter bellariivorans]|uniref:Lipocalin-like domain-containing protein n=1 Tax=Prolixibacter bellariivorans TaxID=314319 RepID=A0A5M4AY24_9BACT|nr:hypothetical protein [Prolixibacter bellariivorans]GET32819.1 hypothetical protein PbJCM13498_16820 [Prolixibacter bellariivorans]